MCACGRTALHGDGHAPGGTTSYRLATPLGPARRSPSRVAEPSLTQTYMTASPAAPPCPMLRVLVLAGAVAALLGSPRNPPKLSFHPLRPSGRCLARLRAGHARRAEDEAQSDRRRSRSLHGSLERGRGASAGRRTGGTGRGSRGPGERGIAPWSRSTGRRAGRTGARRRTGRRGGAATSRRFAAAAANRYPWVKLSLDLERAEPAAVVAAATPLTYVTKLLNPALRRHSRRDSRREGRWRRDSSAPRPAASRLSPGSRASRPRAHSSDAYAHNPYPLDPLETPSFGGCRALRDDHDVDARTDCSARCRLCFRIGEADLADGVRLPDEPARSRARRLQGVPGPLRQRGCTSSVSRRETSTC